MHLPGKITYKEIDEMIATVDKNKDGKISFSEFRVEDTPFILINAETKTRVHSKVHNHGEGPYLGLFLGESAY